MQYTYKNIPESIELVCLLLLSGTPLFSKPQTPNVPYEWAYSHLVSMLEGTIPADFQQAVFTVENAYYENTLNPKTFDTYIDTYALLCQSIVESGQIRYKGADTQEASMQCAVFLLMSDSISFATEKGIAIHPPFQYNDQDYAGLHSWDNTFVYTLMHTQKGNCRSLSFLYKMIMHRLGRKAYLSLAPCHMYIKVHNRYAGWYNIELTCADFPTDAWILSSGYIHTDAVRNGLYMDTLSERQSIALCLYDLALGYQAKFGRIDDAFPLRCCKTALHYFPHYINALLLQNEIQTYRYKRTDKKTREAFQLRAQINEQVKTLHRLGYRLMPDSMYQKWLDSMDEQAANRTLRSILYHK